MEEVIISGVIEAVVYKNNDNGYAVVRIAASDGSQIIAVGCIPNVGVGEYIDASGTWGEHPTYGIQFKINAFRRARPVTSEMILEYLSSGTIHGIGRKTAEKIVSRFGEDSLAIIENDPERLCEISGITLQKARQISHEFEKQNVLALIMEFMSNNGFDPTCAISLFRIYGVASYEVLHRNPYVLASEAIGVPFNKVDEIALQMGFDGDSDERLRAAVLYELEYNAEAGHSFIPYDKLCAVTSSLLDIDVNQIEATVRGLLDDGEVVREDICNVSACYLASLYEAESNVADKLFAISCKNNMIKTDCEELIKKAEADSKITFEPLQKEAIRTALKSSVFLLTGGPGTGKTTVIKGILYAFSKMNMRVLLAAPTGRAAKRLSESCGVEAKTIHRLLEIEFSDNVAAGPVFSRDEQNPLETDVLIIDETSMVDIRLMSAVLSAMPKNGRIILVGDADQLPSVGPGNVFKDLLGSECFETVRLNKIYRQAAESDIIIGAHDVNNGIMPNLTKKDNDLFFLRRSEPESLTETVLELCKTRLPKNMNIPSSQIQVLSVSRMHETGTVELNRRLQNELNPPSPDKAEKRTFDKLFRVGDRVMQIKNNYTINWFGMYGGETGTGIFNGDIGEVIAIDERDETLTVNFDSRLVHYPFASLGELELAYAMTVHKSQGSEFRAVVFVALGGAPVLLHRSILYTAMTRAKELLIIVGEQGTIQYMVENNKQRNRYSALKTRIKRLFQ